MRVVIDTNVLVGACLGTGAPSYVIEACVRGLCQPLIGNALLAEYEDVCGRVELFGSSRLTDSERNELLDAFFSRSQWTRVYFSWRPNLPDEGDNHLIELAVAGGAEFIVTRNLRDLTQMELRFPKFRIVSPEDFLKEL